MDGCDAMSTIDSIDLSSKQKKLGPKCNFLSIGALSRNMQFLPSFVLSLAL